MLESTIQVNEERQIFQLLFLKDDEGQSVEVEEVEEIDFETVIKRVEQGESVFITRKRKQKLNTTLLAREDAAEPWYLSCICGSKGEEWMEKSLW